MNQLLKSVVCGYGISEEHLGRAASFSFLFSGIVTYPDSTFYNFNFYKLQKDC